MLTWTTFKELNKLHLLNDNAVYYSTNLAKCCVDRPVKRTAGRQTAYIRGRTCSWSVSSLGNPTLPQVNSAENIRTVYVLSQGMLRKNDVHIVLATRLFCQLKM